MMGSTIDPKSGRARPSRSVPPVQCDIIAGGLAKVICMIEGAIGVLASKDATMSYHFEDERIVECTYDMQNDDGVYRIMASDEIAVTLEVHDEVLNARGVHPSVRADIRMMRSGRDMDAIMPDGVAARLRHVLKILRKTSAQSAHRLDKAQSAMTRAVEACCAYAGLEGSGGGTVRLTAPVTGRGAVVDWRPDSPDDATDMEPVMRWAQATMLPIVRISNAGNDVDVAVIMEPLRIQRRCDVDPVAMLRSTSLIPEGLLR